MIAIGRCERVRVRFQQRDVGGEWEALEPGTAADFAWEEPLAARRLRVRMDGCGGAWRDGAVHEYSLDVLRVCTLSAIFRECIGRHVSMAIILFVSHVLSQLQKTTVNV